MINFLNKTRSMKTNNLSMKQYVIHTFFIAVFGAVMGIAAKYADSDSVLGDIGTNLGIWILIAVLLSVFSRSPITAALHVFVFFVAMLIFYYLYTVLFQGFFPRQYLIAWGVITLFTPFCAYLEWYACGEGWIAAISCALPISLLLVNGYSFYYTFSIVQGLDLFFAVILFAIVPKDWGNRLYTAPMIVLFFIIFKKIDIIARIFGGL